MGASFRRGLQKDAGQRHAVSSNILDRAFVPSAPNQKWITDFTYIWTAQGWLHVAAVVDLYFRRVEGWSMSSSMADQLVTGVAANPTASCATPTRAAKIHPNSSSG